MVIPSRMSAAEPLLLMPGAMCRLLLPGAGIVAADGGVAALGAVLVTELRCAMEEV